ncbi:heterokaryon incompatibility protein-domain-containing protein [Xylaria intraflava]|nr:heterokaryon incompatibility protein-domain-containing protein [Xylaria intraflava]
MRLIHIPSMVLREYHGENVPPYAILSHTWGDQVSFSDFEDGKGPSRQGYKKIAGCCAQAASDGLDAVWIDTCCIDKRSSAELSEAINSMFKWYRNAAICYAYLDDVVIDDNGMGGRPRLPLPTSFAKSRWFTRGWTLQELLAPSVVVFYSVDWVSIGSRRDLAGIISKITRIDMRSFESATGNFEDFSIAQRMSWASQRQTTRIEDQAYCLLGLFSVNMPLLYGEGEQAFIRLQQEIMKESDDQTIFAWGGSDLVPFSGSESDLKGGILAPSPKLFAGSGHIVRSRTDEIYEPYATTNKGLQIALPLLDVDTSTTLIAPRKVNGATIPRLTLTASYGKIAVLDCQPFGDDESRIGIYVEQQREHGPYTRVNYRDGITLVSTREARKMATLADLLIQLRNETTQTAATQADDDNKRILIRPFKNLAAQFKLNRTRPKERQPEQGKGRAITSPPWPQQPAGSLSLFLDSPVSRSKLLEYTDGDGHQFVLILERRVATKPARLEAFIAENTEIAKDEAGVQMQIRDAIYMAENHGYSRIQESSYGLIKIEARIIEARHASIVNLEARRETSSIPETKVSSSLKPPLIVISDSGSRDIDGAQ